MAAVLLFSGCGSAVDTPKKSLLSFCSDTTIGEAATGLEKEDTLVVWSEEKPAGKYPVALSFKNKELVEYVFAFQVEEGGTGLRSVKIGGKTADQPTMKLAPAR